MGIFSREAGECFLYEHVLLCALKLSDLRHDLSPPFQSAKRNPISFSHRKKDTQFFI